MAKQDDQVVQLKEVANQNGQMGLGKAKHADKKEFWYDKVCAALWQGIAG